MVPLWKILVVDDEANMRHMLSATLAPHGFDVSCASGAEEALDSATQGDFDFILSDVRMPGMDGIQLVGELNRRGVRSVVILMSAYGNTDLALEAVRKGAYDYISKPFKTEEIVLTLRKAAERERLRREVVRLRRRLMSSEEDRRIVGAGAATRELIETIERIAVHDSPVLITGESGTGKELAATEIHRRSGRAEGPFVAVNCGALPEGLLESELFGHAAGAFTGAREAKPGLFEEADGGTLLLDEIGSMDTALQVKLNRFLDSGEVRRLGETRLRRVSVRVIAATNENMDEAVGEGRFRKDLYYRLNVVELRLRPLRERREDIVPLVERFVSVFNASMGKKVGGISKEAREALLHYDWKGNVRELRNVIERAVMLASGDVITVDCLPEDMRRPGPAPWLPDGGDENDFSIKKAVRSVEKSLILRALNRTGGNRSRAAALLEISYPSLLQKIKEYGLR
jgi:two-component system response regulator AtoC